MRGVSLALLIGLLPLAVVAGGTLGNVLFVAFVIGALRINLT